MNIKEIKNELLKTLNILKEEKFAAPTNLDAQAVKISERAVGGKVELVNADGSLSVAPDGEYILSDGFHFVVKDGLISSIINDSSDADASDEEMADDNSDGDSADAASDDSANEVDVQKAIADNTQAIADLKQELDAIKQLLEQLQGNVNVAATKEDVEGFKAEVTKLNETIVKLAKLPVEKSKVNKSTTAKDKTDAKIMEFIQSIKK